MDNDIDNDLDNIVKKTAKDIVDNIINDTVNNIVKKTAKDTIDTIDNNTNADIRNNKLDELDKNIIKSESEYDELFDLMAKRRQLLQKN